jgi:glycosyltransferase involved in cell wall biosynthesis
MAVRPLIAIRATPLLFPAAGVAQYIRSLANELIAAGENIALFTPLKWALDPTFKSHESTGAKAIRTSMFRGIPRPRQAARVLETMLLALNACTKGVALYHEPATLPLPFRGPTVLTVHDLSWIRFPETHPADRLRTLKGSFPTLLRRARHVITDSHFVRSELESEFGLDPARITTAHLGARSSFRPRSAHEVESVLRRFGLRHRCFFLSVGTLEPRKNLVAAIKAFGRLPTAARKRHALVIVGATGWKSSGLQREIHALASQGEAIPLGFLDDEDLAHLYSAATALVYVSLYEGFGLPPLEAMASGTPVLVSDCSSIPEVVGDAGLLVQPHDEVAIGDAMLRLIDDTNLWRACAARGIERAGSFSWAQCAATTREVYRSVLQKS